MTSTEQTITPPPAEEPRKLRRSRDDRWIAGVSGGLAAYFGLSAAVYRVLFVALALAGGTGLVLYIAAAIVMPSEGEDESAMTDFLQRHRHRPWLVIGLALLALLLVSIISEPGFDFGWLVLLGIVGLIVWAVRGGARRLAVVAAMILAVAIAATGVAIGVAQAHGGIGDRTERPLVAADIPAQYELGAGSFELDLRDVELPPGDTHVDVDVGVGELEVILPADVAVRATAEVGWGETILFSQRDDGRHVLERFADPGFGDAERRLVIDARVKAGELNIPR